MVADRHFSRSLSQLNRQGNTNWSEDQTSQSKMQSNDPYKYVRRGFDERPNLGAETPRNISINADHTNKMVPRQNTNYRSNNYRSHDNSNFERNHPRNHYKNTHYNMHRKNFSHPKGTGYPNNYMKSKSIIQSKLLKKQQNQHHNNEVQNPKFSWFQVTLCNSFSCEKSFLINSLQSLCEKDQFIPIKFCQYENDFIFFIKGANVARSLIRCTNKISLPSGKPLKIIVHRSSEPKSDEIDANVNNAIKNLLEQRFNQNSKTIDLSSLSSDPLFCIDDIYISLNSDEVVKHIFDVLSNVNIQVDNLFMQNNGINSLSNFKDLGKIFPNLKRLHIGDNNIVDINELSHLSSLKETIIELVLEGNPFVVPNIDPKKYINNVRKFFPKVNVLDMLPHESPVVFDLKVDEKISLDQVALNREYFVDPSVKSHIYKFLDQYFSIFDSENKDALLLAYDENAQFSISYFSPPITNKAILCDYTYIKNNHNLVDSNYNKKFSKIYTKRADILYRLSKFGLTKHDSESLSIQCLMVADPYISVRIVGKFSEQMQSNKTRSFQRVFVIKKTTGQNQEITYTIVNDLLSLTTDITLSNNSNENQIERDQVQRVQKMTGLKYSWAKKCLLNSDWNHELALQYFHEMNNKNQMPENAFVNK